MWNDPKIKMPDSGKNVMLKYLNSSGKRRIVKGFWCPQYHMESNPEDDDVCVDYCEKDDTDYLLEGWYESIDNWDDFSSVFISPDIKILGWQPLPLFDDIPPLGLE